MIKVGDYVVHKGKFGLGIVKNVSYSEIKAEFLSYGIRGISKNKDGSSDYLIKLDDAMIKYLLDNLQTKFSSNVFNKGLDYFRKNKVGDITFSENKISAIVHGTDDYFTEVTFEDGKLRFICSCPVEGVCKHVVALLIASQQKLKALRQNKPLSQSTIVVEKQDIKLKVDFDKFNFNSLIDRYNTSLYFDLTYSSNLSLFLTELAKYSYKNKEKTEEILQMILIKNATKNIVFPILKEINNSYLIERYRYLKSKVDSDSHSYAYWNIRYSNLTLYKCIYNKNFNFIVENITTFDLNVKEIISFIFKANILNNEELKDSFYEKIKDIRITKTILEELKTYLDKETLRKLICYLNLENITIDLFFEVCEKSDVVSYLLIQHNPVILDYFICNLDYYKELDLKKCVHVLALNAIRTNKTEKNILIKYLKEIPNTKYILAYSNFDFIETIGREKVIDYNSLKAYFDFSYEIEITKDEVIIEKKISLGSDYVASIFEEVNNEQVFLDCYGELENNTLNKVLDIILGEVYGDAYKNDIEEAKIALSETLKLKKIQKFEREINTLYQKLDEEPIYLTEGNKMDVDFIFKAEHNTWVLSLKVGNSKKYVVKRVGYFLECIKHNRFFEYGKGLAFSHCYENFNERVVDVLKYLQLILNSYYENKDVIIPDFRMGELLKLLKGQKIILNDKEYLVRLDEVPFKVYIDENYHIKTNLAEHNFYILGTNGFIFDNVNSCVDIINVNRNELKLIELLTSYTSFDIKDTLELFKEKIYYRFSELFEVADSIKEDFIIKEIEIKAYFDYSNRKISVNTILINDSGMEVNEKDLKVYEKNKLSKYESYLKNLGFNNAELIEENKILNFLTMDFTYLKKIASVYLSETISCKKIENFSRQVIKLDNDFSMLNAIVEDSKYSDEELYEILRAVKLKKKFILLKNDTIINLDNDEATEFYEAVNDLKLNQKKLSEAQNIPIYNALNAYSHKSNCKIDNYLLNMIDEIANFKNIDIPLPKINGELREYQIEGYRWLSILSKYHLGGILADDMGLGKTVQIITLLKANIINKPSLIVCPKTLIFNWKSEFLKFDGETKVVEIYGTSSKREELINSIDYNENAVYITSYESLRSDIDLYKKEFKYFILDEAQVIKNVYAGKSVAVKNVKAEYKFALTGTPDENNIIDLWSIFDFIMPNYFEELKDFKAKYTQDKNFVEKISKRITPFILRRTKENVLDDLPSKYEHIMTVSMSSEQQKIYDSFKLEAQNMLKVSKVPFDLFPYLMKLRQICIDPSLFLEEYSGISSKMETLKELVTEYISGGHKILIFSQFVKALDIVERFLIDKGINYYYLTGKTEAAKRKEYADEFNANDSVKVFLISLKAGGTGLNLIGADTVIHLDPWWNQAVEAQATDRTYRIGQVKNVEVIKLICEDSIEKRVIELQNIKKDLIDKLISNDDTNITKLSKEDLSYILN